MTNSIDITASPANSVDRRGVNKKWVSSWKASLKNRQEWLATYDPHTRELLDFYVATGKTKQHNTDPLQPGEVAWEGYLGSDLNLYALLRAYECEKAAIVEKSFNVEFARRGFAASYLSQCIALGQQKKSMALRGWQIACESLDVLLFTALGVVIGCTDEAFRLAKMQIVAYRNDWFGQKDKFPIFHFILRILADHLGEPPLVLTGEAMTEPVFSELFAHWKTSRVEELVPLCLAACDVHTHRCTNSGDDEFSFGEFGYTPIEILLLFKLRELRGLALPVIDHPLMNSGFSTLPNPAKFKYDELIAKVHARMVQDGFDENWLMNAYGLRG
jgi:hypothetical protein